MVVNHGCLITQPRLGVAATMQEVYLTLITLMIRINADNNY